MTLINQSILFQKYTSNKIKEKHCSTVPWSPGSMLGFKMASLKLFNLFSPYLLSHFHFCCYFKLSFCESSFHINPIIFWGEFSYVLQEIKWFIVSSFISQVTQRLSWYFQGCQFFMSKVFDLKLKIILVNEEFLLSKIYSLIFSTLKTMSFVFLSNEFYDVRFLRALSFIAFLTKIFHCVFECWSIIVSSTSMLRFWRSFWTKL